LNHSVHWFQVKNQASKEIIVECKTSLSISYPPPDL